MPNINTVINSHNNKIINPPPSKQPTNLQPHEERTMPDESRDHSEWVETGIAIKDCRPCVGMKLLV